MKPELFQLILPSTWESLYMTLISAALAYVAGLPLGILLVVTDKNGIRPMPALNTVLGTIVNLLRSVPFLILFIALRDVTSAIVGKAYGARAVIVALHCADGGIVPERSGPRRDRSLAVDGRKYDADHL